MALTFAARGRRLAGAALYAAAVLAIFALRLRQAYRGPEAYLLDPLLGYLPGPLYDEAVPLDGRLLLARLRAARLGGAPGRRGRFVLWEAVRRGGPSPRPAPPRWWPPLGACLLVLAPLPPARLPWAARRCAPPSSMPWVGAGTARALTFDLPSELPAAAAAEYLAECEFHAADVAALLGITVPPHVTVFVYRSAEEKRR